MNNLAFARLTSLDLLDLFETESVKLNNVIRDSKLPNHIKRLMPYFQQTIPESNYYVDEFTFKQTNLTRNFQYFTDLFDRPN